MLKQEQAIVQIWRSDLWINTNNRVTLKQNKLQFSFFLNEFGMETEACLLKRLKLYLSLCTKGIRLLRSSKCEGQVLWFSESSAIKWFLVIIQNFKIRTNCGTFIFKVLAWVLGWHSSTEPPYFKNLSQLLSPSATQQVSDVKSK